MWCGRFKIHNQSNITGPTSSFVQNYVSWEDEHSNNMSYIQKADCTASSFFVSVYLYPCPSYSFTTIHLIHYVQVWLKVSFKIIQLSFLADLMIKLLDPTIVKHNSKYYFKYCVAMG